MLTLVVIVLLTSCTSACPVNDYSIVINRCNYSNLVLRTESDIAPFHAEYPGYEFEICRPYEHQQNGEISFNVNEQTNYLLTPIEFSTLPCGIVVGTHVTDTEIEIILKHFDAIERGDFEAFWATMEAEDSPSMNHIEGLVSYYIPSYQNTGIQVRQIEASYIDWLFRVVVSNSDGNVKVYWLTIVSRIWGEESSIKISAHLAIENDANHWSISDNHRLFIEESLAQMQNDGLVVSQIELTWSIPNIFRINVSNGDVNGKIYWVVSS